MTNTSNVELVKASAEQLESSGFCLQQALIWMHKCYSLGAVEIAATDEIAAANIKRMTASGEAHIEARLDLSQQSCAFYFCQDNATGDQGDMRLMTLFFEPPKPAGQQH